MLRRKVVCNVVLVWIPLPIGGRSWWWWWSNLAGVRLVSTNLEWSQLEATLHGVLCASIHDVLGSEDEGIRRLRRIPSEPLARPLGSDDFGICPPKRPVCWVSRCLDSWESDTSSPAMPSWTNRFLSRPPRPRRARKEHTLPSSSFSSCSVHPRTS